jgi:hypothetical protein
VTSCRSHALYWGVGLGAWLALAGAALRAERSLRDGSLITGYALFALMLALALFKLRKRLIVLPLGTIRAWMSAHWVLGVIAVPLYFQHTGSLWPEGFYERALAACFYVAMLSGIAGYALERLLPRRLTHLELEVVYERIPTEIAALRARAEALIVSAAVDTGSDTLGRYYGESLDWFFRRPRFLLSHALGSGRGARWVRAHAAALRRYLNDAERRVLEEIERLALRKAQLDAHYALQGVLKLWLFVHVPAAVLVIALSCWHLLVVHIYAL